MADFHRSRGDWEAAAKHLETAARLVEDKKQRSSVYQQLGEVYQLHLNRPTLALENYLVSFMCDAANRETFERLDRLYTATRRHKELVGILKIAIETTEANPKTAPFDLEELYARRAHIEFKYLGAHRDAARSLVAALRINPTNDRYLRLLEAHLLDEADAGVVLEAYEIRAGALPADSSELLDLIRAQAAVCERLPQRREQMIEYYTRILELDPGDKSAFSKIESFYRENERWDEIIELYRRQLRWVTKSEDTVSLYHRIARTYEAKKRDLAAAAETYATLLQIIPASLSALRGLGRLYEATRRWDDLIDVSEREVKLVDDDRVRAHLLFKIGSIYETHRGNEEKALSYYERAVENDQRCVPALHGLRDIFQRRKEPEHVIQYLEAEAEIWDNPRERASIHARIAEVFWESLKDANQAIQHLKKALALVPDSGPALHRLLDIYYIKKQWPEAAPIAYSLSQHPESIHPDLRGRLFRRRGIIAYELGNRREAIESLKIALDIDANDSKAFDLLSDILNEEADADVHADFFNQLQRDFADHSDSAGLGRVKRFLGRQAENRSEVRAAIGLFQEAIELDPNSLAGLIDLVRVFSTAREFSGGLDCALDFAGKTARNDVRHSATVIGARFMIDHLDERQRGRFMIKQVLTENPNHLDALFLGAQAAFLDADWPAARNYMERLVAVDANTAELDRPTRCEHIFYLGRILEIGFEDLEKALQLFARAREEYPVDPRPLKAAALILFRQSNWHRLDRLLGRAVQGAASVGGDDATVPLLLLAAKLAHKRNQESKAEDYLHRLLHIDPVHKEARQLMVELVRTDAGTGSVQLHDLLDSNVLDERTLKGLGDLYHRKGNQDASACFWEVLGLIGDPAAQKPERPQPLLSGPVVQRLPVDRIHVLLHPPLVSSGYVAALQQLTPVLTAMRVVSAPSLPSRSQRVGDAALASINTLLKEVMGTLPHHQGQIGCYREGPRGTAMTVAVAESPTVAVEMNWNMTGSHGQSEIRFMLGRAADLLAFGGFTVLAVPRTDLTRVLWWLSRWRESGESAPPHHEAPWMDVLPPDVLAQVAAVLADPNNPFEPLTDAQHAERLAIQLEEAVEVGADRMGLLLSNDVRGTVGAILRLETGAGLEMMSEPLKELSRSKRVRRLLRYSVSEDHFELRRLLRTARGR